MRHGRPRLAYAARLNRPPTFWSRPYGEWNPCRWSTDRSCLVALCLVIDPPARVGSPGRRVFVGRDFRTCPRDSRATAPSRRRRPGREQLVYQEQSLTRSVVSIVAANVWPAILPSPMSDVSVPSGVVAPSFAEWHLRDLRLVRVN